MSISIVIEVTQITSFDLKIYFLGWTAVVFVNYFDSIFKRLSSNGKARTCQTNIDKSVFLVSRLFYLFNVSTNWILIKCITSKRFKRLTSFSQSDPSLPNLNNPYCTGEQKEIKLKLKIYLFPALKSWNTMHHIKIHSNLFIFYNEKKSLMHKDILNK